MIYYQGLEGLKEIILKEGQKKYISHIFMKNYKIVMKIIKTMDMYFFP
jgi:hypothetical protein